MFTRRAITGKAGKHVSTFRRRSRSRSRSSTSNSNSKSSGNLFQRELRAARARMRLRAVIMKILNEIQMKPGTGSKYKEAERRFYKLAFTRR